MQNSEFRAQKGESEESDGDAEAGGDAQRAEEHRGGPRRTETPQEIGERTLDYGVRAIRLFRALQARPDRSGWIIGRQFLRVATSIGANVAEARSGESRKDFAHKLQIALKEARESLYWLRLIERSALLDRSSLAPLQRETDEIIAILVSIIRSTQRTLTSSRAARTDDQGVGPTK